MFILQPFHVSKPKLSLVKVCIQSQYMSHYVVFSYLFWSIMIKFIPRCIIRQTCKSQISSWCKMCSLLNQIIRQSNSIFKTIGLLFYWKDLILLLNFPQLNNMGKPDVWREICKTRYRTINEVLFCPLCQRESAITILLSILFYFWKKWLF